MPTIMLKLTIPFVMLLCMSISAQVDPSSVMGIPSTTTLTDVTSQTGFSEGNLVYVTDVNKIYIFDGTQWVEMLDSTARNTITNELYFEDATYYYVSVVVNASDWMVTRYDRSNINTEDNAMGTGAQPSDLATVSGLTY